MQKSSKKSQVFQKQSLAHPSNAFERRSTHPSKLVKNGDKEQENKWGLMTATNFPIRSFDLKLNNMPIVDTNSCLSLVKCQ